MQIKYDTTTDVLLIDFANDMPSLEKDVKPREWGVDIVEDGKGGYRGIVIHAASNTLPRGTRERVEVIRP